MPEIPEVETIISGIRKELIGQPVQDILVFDERRVSPGIEVIKGKKLRDVRRRGKAIYLIFDDNILEWHLKLDGFVRLFFEPIEPEKPWIIGLSFPKGLLILGDKRKLATANVVPRIPMQDVPDALEIEYENFRNLLESSKKTIKSLLMDQKLIGGIGNRYADEILWRSGVHPESKANKLSEEVVKKLYFTMKEVLQEAVELGGDEHYTDIYGNPGRWSASVHGRKVCPVCGTELVKVKVGGRTSYICPKCQIKYE